MATYTIGISGQRYNISEEIYYQIINQMKKMAEMPLMPNNQFHDVIASCYILVRLEELELILRLDKIDFLEKTDSTTVGLDKI